MLVQKQYDAQAMLVYQQRERNKMQLEREALLITKQQQKRYMQQRAKTAGE